MTKSHYDYNVYTPELINELKKITANVPRPEGVKKLVKRLAISNRSARRVYSKYIEQDSSVKTVKEDYAGRPLRRLILDIETSPNIGLFWRAGWKLDISADSIIKERAIICVGYKWNDEKAVHVLTWDENQNDKALLAALIPIIAQADEIVFHNGSQFDFPWIRTRALFHGLPPIPDVKEVDTLQWAKSKFYFNSNKLDYIAKLLGIGCKLKTEFGLWKEILLNKCPKAMATMCDYCKHDVILLEKVWARLFELMPPKTHSGVINGGDKWTCPRTGSKNVIITKTVVTAAGGIKYQMKNKDTGGYYTISATAHKAYLEAKHP